MQLNTGQMDALLFSVLVQYSNGWSRTGVAKPLPRGKKVPAKTFLKWQPCHFPFFMLSNMNTVLFWLATNPFEAV